MSNQLYRIQGIKGIIDLLQVTSEAHLGVSQFKSGLALEDSRDNIYPLAFLENGFDVRQEDANSEIYSIALNIADRMPSDATSESINLALSKTTQILDEIHYQLQTLSPSSIKVGFLNKLVYQNQGADDLAVTRGEFTIRIARYTTRNHTGMMQVELPNLPKFGNNYIIFWDNIKDKPELVTEAELDAVTQQINTSIQTTKQSLEDALEAAKIDLEDKILISSQTTETIGITVDGGLSPVKPGSKGFREIPFSGKIVSYTLISPATGNVTFDLKKGTLGNLESAVSICGNTKPTLLNQSQKLGTDLAGWDLQVEPGDIIEFVVESSSLSKIQLFLNIKRD